MSFTENHRFLASRWRRGGLPLALGVLLVSSAGYAQLVRPPPAKKPADSGIVGTDAGLEAGPEGGAPRVDPPDPPSEVEPAALVDAAAEAATAAPEAGVAPEPSVAPAPSASVEAPPENPNAVQLKGAVVFEVLLPRAGLSAEQRAKRATHALNAAFEAKADPVRTERQQDTAVVYVGTSPIIQLGAEDAEASGDSSVDVHAAAIADKIRQAITRERQRARIATTVFSVSLVVFAGLIALYLIRKLGDFAERAHDWLAHNAARLKGIRLQSIEVVSPALMRGTLSTGLSLGRWLGQGGVAYLWLVFALSLFETTQGYTEKLTGFLLEPLGGVVKRFATSLPILFLVIIASFAVALLVRFIALFFESVERRETSVSWLPANLARPTGVLLRLGVIVAALVFAGPVITGDSEGAFSRVGIVLLVALGLAAVPLLATIVVGTTTLFSGRLALGELTEIGDQRGWVGAVNLLGVDLVDGEGVTTTIPHLMTLIRPTRRLGTRLTTELWLPLSVVARAEASLVDAADQVGIESKAEVLEVNSHSLRFRVSTRADNFTVESRLVSAVALAARELVSGNATKSDDE